MEEGVDVPRVKIKWPVLEDHQPIRKLAIGDHLAVLEFVTQSCDPSHFIELDVPERRFQLTRRSAQGILRHCRRTYAYANSPIAVRRHSFAPHEHASISRRLTRYW